MNRKVLWLPVRQEKTRAVGLLLCGALFVFGCFVGTMAAGFITNAGQLGSDVREYLALLSDKSSNRPDLFAAVADAFKYHLSAVFFGFSVLGVVCIPLLAAVRGFFLSFTVSAIIRLLGGKGVLLTLSMFGISTLITVPCFFIISVTAFSASQQLLRLAISKGGKSQGMPPSGRALVACVFCLALLLVSALIETYLTPMLIGYAAAHISL